MSVERDKYNRAKDAAITWHNMFQETKEKIVKLEQDLALCKTNEIELVKKNIQYENEIERWKKLSDILPDPNTFEEIESENRNYLKTIKSLKKQLSDTDEKYKDKIAQLEREKLLYEGRVHQLEEARKDLQDRYTELRQDMREQRLNYIGKLEK